MDRVSNEAGGGALALAGVALTVFHLAELYGLRASPGQFTVQFLPPALSLALAAVGVELARGRLATDGLAGRLLAWTAAGSVALVALGAWVFAGVVVRGFPLMDPLAALLALATFGALGGALVGVYDVKRLEQARFLERLNRINDTLRIATQALVDETDRERLEQTVCERLTDSDPYDAVWLGRYDEGDAEVRPVAWSGFDDEYVESIVVTVDDSPTGSGPGGRAIKTGEIQSVPDVFADPTMEPWWDLLESHGITSLAVVPIRHDDTVYGFFSIYTERDDVFDDREQEVLSELGETIGHAIASIEARERLARRERELARQNERLEEFAGVVSHDLRNPLNVAAGRVEIAGNEHESEHLAVATDALERMEELITDLLSLARQGAAVDEREQADLGALVDQAWATVDAPEATLRIDGVPGSNATGGSSESGPQERTDGVPGSNATEDELGAVECDPSRVRQLLENLFRNAVEHGGADVTVTVGRTADGFFVADDGPGVPADSRDEIFDVGFSTDDRGTGFGLNIVEQIARAHGWDVSVGESADGGARFEFTGVGPNPSVADRV
ncbi:GAF domain-containing protein [Halosimplex sp. TS25]|uniref:GAF domain-containing sensor histidine kinase n=1 Tax=Halosimplex rarum TaxID=3396619 RepID=UPI0039E99CA8